MYLLYSPHGVIPANYWPGGTETITPLVKGQREITAFNGGLFADA